MPKLPNEQHEKFVRALVDGLNQGEAYLAAGYRAKSIGVASAAASSLLKNEDIHGRLVELQELNKPAESAVVDDTNLTLIEHMQMLRILRDEARAEGKLQAAIQAEVKRGELRKFYIKQVESGKPGDFADVSDEELDKFLAENLGDIQVGSDAKH